MKAEAATAELVNECTPCEASSDPAQAHYVEWHDAAEELRRQAVDLQRLLAQRLVDLDRREAVVNAHSADLESQSRAARLWLREQHAALDQREAELCERENTVAQRTSEISAAEAYQEQSRQAIDQQIAAHQNEQALREAQLSALKQRLDAQSVALDEAQQRVRAERESIEHRRSQALQEVEQQKASAAETARRLLQGVERRRVAIEKMAAQRAVADREVVDVAAEFQKLATRERRFIERVRMTRGRLLERARRWAAQLRKKDEQLRRQREELLARRVELEQLRAEVMNRRRELLELRSATEHLLSESPTRGQHGPMAGSLSAAHAALAGHHQASREELLRQQQTLENLRSEVAARYSQLVHQRDEIINLARRRRQIEASRQGQTSTRRADPGAA